MALVSFTRERGKKAAVFLLYEILLKRVFLSSPNWKNRIISRKQTPQSLVNIWEYEINVHWPMQRILFCVSVVYTFTRCILSSHRNTPKLLIILTDPFGKEEKKEDRLFESSHWTPEWCSIAWVSSLRWHQSRTKARADHCGALQ